MPAVPAAAPSSLDDALARAYATFAHDPRPRRLHGIGADGPAAVFGAEPDARG